MIFILSSFAAIIKTLTWTIGLPTRSREDRFVQKLAPLNVLRFLGLEENKHDANANLMQFSKGI